MDYASGRMLDHRYRLGAVLGRGGMATVYAAADTKLRRPVAVKLFHPGTGENTAARLKTEARLLGGLSHPGLLKVFDVSIAAGELYLVLQLISGRTLRQSINDGPLRPVVVARLGVRLAETLRYVHSRQIVHRDIKPSNVLLDQSGTGYLADFGIATLIGGARLTRSGHCMGTAAYLSPEQVRGDEPGPPVDIYALGLVLLECLTGRVEYPGTDVESTIARLARAPRVPSWLPPALLQTLVAMTAPAAADRPDAARCVELFEDYLAGPTRAADPPTVVIAPPEPTMPQPEPPARWRPAQVAVAAAALAGVATVGMLLTGGRPAQPAGPPTPTPAPVVAVLPETAVGQVVVESPAPVPVRQQPKQKGKPDKGGRGEG